VQPVCDSGSDFVDMHGTCGQSPPPVRNHDYDDTILHGDSLEVLPTLPPRFVNVAFLDPPYNQGIDYGEGSKADKLPSADYLTQIETAIRESVKRLTDRGSIWVLSPEKWADEMGAILSDVLPRRNRIIWREAFGQYGETRFPGGHRHLFWHVRDMQRSPFNCDDIRVPSQRMAAGDKRAKGPRVPDDVWEIPRLVGNANERFRAHPCQLPEELLRRVILASTNRGDLVMDPVAGTGTALRVAQKLDRRYLGIEKQAFFVELIRTRLRQSYQDVLFHK